MGDPGAKRLSRLEIVEDFTSRAKCDEGFLHLRRLFCRNLRADGTASATYRVDVVDRPRLDAVAVLLYRRMPRGIEILTRQNLRPAAFFREGKSMCIPDGRSHLFVEEIVAGLLEPEDVGLEGLKARAAEEAWEEGGIRLPPSKIQILGPPFFVAPGILSEKIFLTKADVTGVPQQEPPGDGSPMEEGAVLRWRSLPSLRAALSSGEIQDAKTEIAVARLLEGEAAGDQ
jgi:ADP-ribose pyrophosphatase